MNLEREQYIKRLETEIRHQRLCNAMIGGVMVGGLGSAMGYDGLMYLIGRETQGLESMVTLLLGVTVGPTVAFIRERRRQKKKPTLQTFKNTDQEGHFQ